MRIVVVLNKREADIVRQAITILYEIQAVLNSPKLYDNVISRLEELHDAYTKDSR